MQLIPKEYATRCINVGKSIEYAYYMKHLLF